MNTSQQENLVFRYLLGDLSEAEQTALELKYFADDEKFEEVWAAENELIDAYVRNRMPRRERELFERSYLKAPRHRERVGFARTLLKVADEAPEENILRATSEPAVSWWQRLFESLRGPQMILAGAMAMALVVLAVGLTWLLVERSRLNEQLARGESGRAAQAQREQELSRQIQELEQQINGQRQQNAQAEAELSRLREELRQAQAQRPVLPESSQPALLSFLLIPGSVRAGGEVRQLTIPASARQVRLQVKSESREYQSYQVRLRAVDGGDILSQSALKANAKSFVIVNVPAARLAAGDYILTLSGLTATGESEEINRYFFRVTRR
ncbi:MAG TPA: hypothetical protein VNQ79_03510 [Blastocatellia bacterium]|nr:hypothetical protein [Blastocatellia bacterium]